MIIFFIFFKSSVGSMKNIRKDLERLILQGKVECHLLGFD